MIYWFILFVMIVNEIIFRKNLLSDNIEFSKHKSFVNSKKIPTSGGFFLIIFFIIFQKELGLINLFYLLIIFLIGYSSDKIRNVSPVIRLILQIFLTILFIINTETFITDVRIDFVNHIFSQNYYLPIIFTTFCFIVLLNGTNFIDGINLNTIGYYILVYLIIFIVSKTNNFNLNENLNMNIILLLIALYILNFLNKSQLGDSGSYLIAFYTAYYVIKFVNLNPQISPYFAILILWYPCFENLFSIFRKIYQKKSISTADNLHLHQNVFFYFKIKDCKNINNLSGFILNLSNLVLLSSSILFFYSTKHLVLFTLINVFVYILTYNILIKNILSKKFAKNIK